jgi:hypothetical protein
MVWQFVVLPGTQTVTVVNRVLMSGLVLVGPASTTTPTTFEPVGVELPEEPLDPVARPLSPPPQESTDAHRAAHRLKRRARDAAGMNLTISVNLRC